MRIIFARLLVGATGLLVVLFAILFAVLQNPPRDDRETTPTQVTPTAPDSGAATPAAGDRDSQPPRTAAVARGRAVFMEQRCRMCHAIEGEGNNRSPLDGVGDRLSEEDIRRWIVAPQEMNPAVTKRGYRLSEEDLEALVAYLTASSRR